MDVTFEGCGDLFTLPEGRATILAKRLRLFAVGQFLERAEEMAAETPKERAISSGDIEGMAADERTGRLAGEATIEDAERLGE